MSIFNRLIGSFYNFSPSMAREKWLRGLSKENLEEWMIKYTIPSCLELKDSPIGGRGLFAKIDLSKGIEFKAQKLFKYTTNRDLLNYVWFNTRTIIGGIGYFCNGTCSYLMAHYNDGDKVGPYTVAHSNVVLYDYKMKFVLTEDIKAGEELILDYGDRYFFNWIPYKGIDYSKIRVGLTEYTEYK